MQTDYSLTQRVCDKREAAMECEQYCKFTFEERIHIWKIISLETQSDMRGRIHLWEERDRIHRLKNIRNLFVKGECKC